MPVHRIIAIPGKFKERKERKQNPSATVAERIRQMRRAADKTVGLKPER